jgi:hypothetical protein
MPVNACVAFDDCKGCGRTLRPLPGSCCVFCSYGSVPCPPIQQGVEPCCAPLPDKHSRDWLANTRTDLIAWWVPPALIVAGLFVSTPLRTGIWIRADPLPVHRALLSSDDAPALALGMMDASLYAWLVLAAFVLLGDKIVWWVTEHAWGPFSSPSNRRG